MLYIVDNPNCLVFSKNTGSDLKNSLAFMSLRKIRNNRFIGKCATLHLAYDRFFGNIGKWLVSHIFMIEFAIDFYKTLHYLLNLAWLSDL